MIHTQRCDTQGIPRVIAHAGLIRLVSEIDDNGPIEHRMLGLTLSDLTRNQIRHAIVTSNQLQLLQDGDRATRPYVLTRRGTELADVYEQMARWARRHNYPARTSTFVTRIQAMLTLLSQHHDADHLQLPTGSSTAGTELRLAGAALSRWAQEVRQPAADLVDDPDERTTWRGLHEH